MENSVLLSEFTIGKDVSKIDDLPWYDFESLFIHVDAYTESRDFLEKPLLQSLGEVADLRREFPVGMISDEQLSELAKLYGLSETDFILAYLKTRAMINLYSDWPDSLEILRNFINRVFKYQPTAYTCLMVDSVIREYDDCILQSGYPYPDPFRLYIFVNELAERAVGIPRYRKALEVTYQTANHEYLRGMVRNSILTESSKLVLESSYSLIKGWRRLVSKYPLR